MTQRQSMFEVDIDILRKIRQYPNNSMNQILTYANVTPMMRSSQVHRLVTKGFVDKQPHPNKKHVSCLTLTGKGHVFLSDAEHLLDVWNGKEVS